MNLPHPNELMQPRIETLTPKKLVGIRVVMSFLDNKTGELWRSFMVRRKEITNNVGGELYSMQLYDLMYFTSFDPGRSFEKWATTEVEDFDRVPEGMDTFTLPAGLYAIFIHKGPASKGRETFQHIFGTWLPDSDYTIDNRPHFERLGEKYKHEHPDSEEEIWIPVKRKN